MAELEYWQRGPVAGIPALLQPVAHALLQVEKEVTDLMKDFPNERLWERPAGMASPAFHLQHLTGVLDRLFTYARSEKLSAAQLEYLRAEGKQNDSLNVAELISNFKMQVEKSLKQLEKTDENELTEFRGVGRAQLPSTVVGLLFHAAEHSMRHLGQLLVTVRIIRFDI